METPKPRIGGLEATKKVSPKAARQLKVKPVGFGSSSPASPSTNASRTPKDRSPKIPERKSPKSPVIPEKKRPGRLTELEAQITELQDELAKTKKELTDSITSKEEAKAKAKAELLQQQLSALSSELEDSKKQQSIDALALKSAIDEVQTLKNKLEMVTQHEDSELQSLKLKLSETLSVFEDMKIEVESCKESEAMARGLVQETLAQLEEAKQTVNLLRNDGMAAKEDYSSVVLELEDSRTRVAILEATVNKLKSRNGDEQEQGKSIDELAKQVAELEAELAEAKSTIEELKANLMDKETELQGISEENECLNMKLRLPASNHQEVEKPENDTKRLRDEVASLKGKLMEKENEIEILKNKSSKVGDGDEDAALAEARAENAELAAELRRLRVQSDQWRKAAEAAASMLSSSPVGNGRLVQRTGSLDSPVTGRVRSPYLDESEDDEDGEDDEDAFKKKNGNVLRKIGGFWKKPQK